MKRMERKLLLKGIKETKFCICHVADPTRGVNDLFKGGAPQRQRNINANKIDTGADDLQACRANEASQA